MLGWFHGESYKVQNLTGFWSRPTNAHCTLSAPVLHACTHRCGSCHNERYVCLSTAWCLSTVKLEHHCSRWVMDLAMSVWGTIATETEGSWMLDTALCGLPLMCKVGTMKNRLSMKPFCHWWLVMHWNFESIVCLSGVEKGAFKREYSFVLILRKMQQLMLSYTMSCNECDSKIFRLKEKAVWHT